MFYVFISITDGILLIIVFFLCFQEGIQAYQSVLVSAV